MKYLKNNFDLNLRIIGIIEDLMANKFDNNRNKTNPKISNRKMKLRSKVIIYIFIELKRINNKRKFTRIESQILLIIMWEHQCVK